MTPQDIEKLKALCEKEGFEITVESETQGMFHIDKKDKWDGVEFVECSKESGGYTKGMIYPKHTTDEPHSDLLIRTVFDDQGSAYNGIYKTHAKPSTEAAYVEQQKAKAKELYGEIKDGDRFDASELGYKGTNIVDFMPQKGYKEGFDYQKQGDRLYYSNVLIYQQGKWAKKVDEPIKAIITSFTLSNPYSTIVFTTSHRIKEGQVDAEEFLNHIEESIEAFLNRKI